jgi:phage gp29-like protein
MAVKAGKTTFITGDFNISKEYPEFPRPGKDVAMSERSKRGPSGRTEAPRELWDIDSANWYGRQQNPKNYILKTERPDRGYEILDEMKLREPEISAALTDCGLAIASLDWGVRPDDPDDKASRDRADLLTSDFKDIDMKSFMRSCAGSRYKGFVASEIPWIWKKHHHGFNTPVPIPQYAWKFDKDTGAPLLVPAGDYEGKPVTPGRFLVVRNTDEQDGLNWYGESEGCDVYYYADFLNWFIRHWLVSAEIAGGVIVWGKFPQGSSDEQKAELYEMVRSMQNAQTGIIPDTQSIEIPKLERINIRDFWKGSCDWFARKVRKRLTGSDLASSQSDGTGTYAMSAQHGEVSWTWIQGTAPIVENGLKELAKLHTLYNYGPEVPAPEPYLDYEPREDQEKLANTIDKLVGAGVKLKADEVYEKTGWTKPAEDDDVIEKKAAPAPSPFGGLPGMPDKNVQPPEEEEDDSKNNRRTDIPVGQKVKQSDDEDDEKKVKSEKYKVENEDKKAKFAEADAVGAGFRKSLTSARDVLLGQILEAAADPGGPYGNFFESISEHLKKSGSYDEARESGLPADMPRGRKDAFSVFVKDAMASLFVLRALAEVKKSAREATFAEGDVFGVEFWPYEQAISYLQSKATRLPPDFYDLVDRELNNWAFTVSNLESKASIEAVRQSLENAERAGITFADWKKEIESTLSAGEIEALKPGQLETVFRTNLQTAYTAASEHVVNEVDPNGEFYPAYEVSKGSDYDCDICDPRNGKVFPRTDDENKPPFHHRCTCDMTMISKYEYEGMKPISEADRSKLPQPGKGFRSSPAKTLRSGIE